jgi:hypothetical protein
MLFILNLLFVVALAGGTVLIFIPQSLADIDRTSEGETVTGGLLAEVNRAILSGSSFKCSEKELNDHLRLVINARETEGFEIFSEFKGILVQLNEDGIEIIFERNVLGFTSTVSAQLTIQIFIEGSVRMTEVKVIGGKFGSLPVTRSLVGLIRKALVNVGNVLAPEKEMLSCLGGITVKDGWLILQPQD